MRTPAEVVERARRAKELLEDETLRGAFEGARAQAIAEWEGAQTVPEREQAWATVHGLQALQRELRSYTDEGEYLRHARERGEEP